MEWWKNVRQSRRFLTGPLLGGRMRSASRLRPDGSIDPSGVFDLRRRIMESWSDGE
jgi:hypothetical protein